MDILKKIALVVVSLVIIGCKAHINEDFDRIEAFMNESPERALAVLDSIKQIKVKGKAATARFALLYSQALDKNYIDVIDDSLITIAENWYVKKGNIKEKFLAHYYKGVVNLNAEKYPEAITAFSSAQSYEEDINDDYLLGLLYDKIGIVYSSHYDYPKSLKAFEASYDYYKNADKPHHALYALLEIAAAYWNMAETTQDTLYDSSESYYLKVMEEGRRWNYSVPVKNAAKYLFIQYVQRGMYDMAEDLLNKYDLRIGTGGAVLNAAIAKFYFSRDNVILGEKALELAWRACVDINDTAKLYQWEYSILKYKGEIEGALKSLEKTTIIQNKAVRKNLQQPILEIQKQNLENDLKYNAYKLRTDRRIIVLVGLLVLMIISIILFRLKVWIIEKDKKLELYIDLLADLECTLQHVKEKVQLQNIQLSSANANAHEVINNRISLINNLSTVFYEKRSTPKAKEIFIKEVESIINDFRTNESDIKWMEQIINDTNNNLIDIIYSSHPNLSNEERRLLCYIYAGFTPKAMSVFFNISIETVYNRKSRLMSKLDLVKEKRRKENR